MHPCNPSHTKYKCPSRILKDLASVDRTVTPWIIFGGHRPMYIDSNYGGPTYRSSADINVMNLMVRKLSHICTLLLDHLFSMHLPRILSMCLTFPLLISLLLSHRSSSLSSLLSSYLFFFLFHSSSTL